MKIRRLAGPSSLLEVADWTESHLRGLLPSASFAALGPLCEAVRLSLLLPAMETSIAMDLSKVLRPFVFPSWTERTLPVSGRFDEEAQGSQ